MDFVNVILQPVVDSLMVPIKKHIGFMMSCKKNVRDMVNNARELKDTRNDVENRMKLKKRNRCKIPTHVPGWLEEVKKVDVEVNNISSNVGGCFSFKTRHDVGKKAFNLIQEIKRLTEEHSRIDWTDHPIAPAEVDSTNTSPPAPSVGYESGFESREETFKEALKALEPDHESHMIALCGMGGVGKTTMMEKLKTAVKEKGMFSFIVEVAVGAKTNTSAIQDVVAYYLAVDLKGITTIKERADKLRACFKHDSEGGKKKILVILDDIWQSVDLKDIGLSRLPNQGVDFKVLLTSRSRDVCQTMGVKDNSIYDVHVLANAEAQRFFWEFIKDSGDADLDPDLRKVGDAIVRKCQGLPIAIKTIAITLRGKKKSIWEDTLTCLQRHINKTLTTVFEVSYKNLEEDETIYEETTKVFLLCGLYPEDFNIPTEELVRYGWGLKLFKEVRSIREARNRLDVCIDQLVNANLLIKSNSAGSIKMHDLVRDFVLTMYSTAENGNMLRWPANDTPDSCKRISLECNGMEEFPTNIKYPNLSFLKLTNGDKSPRFPENFYGSMEKLQVIVYEKMQYPLLPRSIEYSTNLRTLCLHSCSLKFDFHSIGNLLNLEVLSFADCYIQELPSTVGNLKELKLLDLTGCFDLVIDDGVLKKLVNLEELYMRAAHGNAIRFTDGIFNELVELSALEIEFFGNNAHPKRMSFNKLERFKISIGCFLEDKDENTTSFENTLMLVSNKVEILESKIDVLFEKTAVLHLELDEMNDLEDLKCSSFHNLKVLKISKCAGLRYLFTRRVASTMSKLEHLEVSSCDTLRTIIDDEDNGSESITFRRLKFLSLSALRKLVGLCNNATVIELPQLMELRLNDLPDLTSIFPDDNLASSMVAIPKLETLQIPKMNNVCFPMLKTIEIKECHKLVNVFPRNPKSCQNLTKIVLLGCRSIKYLFSPLMFKFLPNLKHVQIIDCEAIEKVVSIRDDEDEEMASFISTHTNDTSFPILEWLKLDGLKRLQHIGGNDGGRCNSIYNQFQPNEAVAMWSLCQFSKHIHVYDCEALSIAIPSYALGHMQNLEELMIRSCPSLKDVFGRVVSLTTDTTMIRPDLPNLKSLALFECPLLRYGFPFSILKSLTKLEYLEMHRCENIRVIVKEEEDGNHTTSSSDELVVFPCLKSVVFSCLTNLEGFFLGTNGFHWPVLDTLNIFDSPKMRMFTQGHSDSPRLKSVRSQKGEHSVECGINNLFHHPTTTGALQEEEVPYPCLDGSSSLPISERMPWFHNNLITLHVYNRPDERYIIGHNDLKHMLKIKKLRIFNCSKAKVIFETFEMNNGLNHIEVREMDFASEMDFERLSDVKCFWKSKQLTVLKFSNLTSLSVEFCNRLKYAFTISVVGSLLHLQELHIDRCQNMEIILAGVEKDEEHEKEQKDDGKENKHDDDDDERRVIEDDGKEKDGDDERRVNEVEFPCLRTLTLRGLWSLKGFCLGMEAIHWPLLDTLEIENCPLTTFTNGQSTTPKLKLIKTSFGLCDAKEGVNSLIRTKIEEGYKFVEE